jgi:uncharacterized membrane protein
MGGDKDKKPKPKFDPNKTFTAVEAEKPPFNPNEQFSPIEQETTTVDEAPASNLFNWRPAGTPAYQGQLSANFKKAPATDIPATSAPRTPSFDKSPFLDLSFNKKPNTFEKKNAFEESKSKLERDIELSLMFSLSSMMSKPKDSFSLTSPMPPVSTSVTADGKLPKVELPEFSLKNNFKSPEEYREAKKNFILNDPDALNEYRQKRLREFDDELMNVPQDFTPTFGSPNNEAPEQYRSDEMIQSDSKIESIKARKNEFVSDIINVAQVVVPETFLKKAAEEKSPVDYRKLGEEFLRITGATQYKDDKAILDELTNNAEAKVQKYLPEADLHYEEDKYKDKDALQRTKQGIEYNFEKTGADLLTNFYFQAAEDIRKRSPEAIDLAMSAIDAAEKATTPEEREQFRQQFMNIRRENPAVAAYTQILMNGVDAKTSGDGIINKFPEVKRRDTRQRLNDAYFAKTEGFGNIYWEAATSVTGDPLDLWRSIFGSRATEDDAEDLSVATGIPVDEVKNAIDEGNFWKGYKIGTSGFLNGVSDGFQETFTKMGMGVKRLLDTDNVNVENRMTSDALSLAMTKAQANKLIDDEGKWNVNPTSVMNAMGYGVGQTTAYAIPTLLTGGVAGEVALIKKVTEGATTIATAMAGSAEDAYQEAAKYTDDESLRKNYMFVTALENALPELIMSPADIVKRI